MSHELRTPLNSLLILAQAADARTPTGTSPRSRSSSRTRSTRPATTCSTLINDILDLSKIESGMMAVHVDEVRIDRRRRFRATHVPSAGRREAARLRRSSATPSSPPAIDTDEKRLQQVLKNLLSNAFKFTEEAAVRCGSTRRERLDTPAIRVLDHAPRASSRSPSSTPGIGIPPDKQRDHLRGVPAGRRGPRAGTAARASASRSAARSPRCSAARSRCTSEAGQGQHLHALPSPDVRGARHRRDRGAPGGERAVAGPLRGSRGPVHDGARDRGERGHDRSGARSERARRRPRCDRHRRPRSCSSSRTTRLRADPARHGAREGLQGHRRVRAARPALAMARRVPAPTRSRSTSPCPTRTAGPCSTASSTTRRPATSRSTSSRRTTRRVAGLRLGAFAHLQKPVTKEALDDAFGEDRGVHRAVPRGTCCRRGRRDPAAGIVELIGDGDVEIIAVGSASEALAALREPSTSTAWCSTSACPT